MSAPEVRFAGSVLGTDTPLALAEFYQRLLGWSTSERETAGVDGATEDWALLRSPAGDRKIEFQYEPLFVPPVWPPVAGRPAMLQHLDFAVADLDAAVGHALAAGAREAEHQPQPDVRVMLDPSGHVFCLFVDDTM